MIIKRLHLIAMAAMLGASAQATTLSAGDLSFTGMARESSYGGWSFVSWVDIAAGTSITFSDNGLDSTGAFKSSVQKENTWTWTATSDLSAGTQVAIFGGSYNTVTGTVANGVTGSAGMNVSTGTLTHSATADGLGYQFDFSNSGEVLYAQQGTSFIAAINSFVAPPASTSDNPLASGLGTIQNINYTAANGGTGDGVIQRTEWYKGPTMGLTAAQYQASILDMSQWSSDTATSAFKGLGLLEGAGQTAVVTGAAVGVGAGDFAIVTSAVPEPSSWALMLLGLGLWCGFRKTGSAGDPARRR